MKYLFYDEKGEVDLIYYVTPPENLGSRYVKYNGEIPEKEGCITKIKVNLETEEVYFEFEEVKREGSLEDEVNNLQTTNETLIQSIAELTAIIISLQAPTE